MPRRRSEQITSRLAGVARAVSERRLALGLDQQEVADLAGCSRQFVSALERGDEGVTVGKVLDVCEVLGLGLRVDGGSPQ
jgi:transcriptional regulator with XRE-family HTH domain